MVSSTASNLGNNQFCPRKYKCWSVVITFTSVDVRKTGYGQIFVRMEFDPEKNFHKLRKKICKQYFFVQKTKNQSNKKIYCLFGFDDQVYKNRSV